VVTRVRICEWPFYSITLAAHFLQTLLNVVEVLTSLKCLKDLCFKLFHCEIWGNYNVGGIATKLRNANSAFSRLEIQEIGVSEWKKTISVWNEVFGMFHHMGSVSAL
jgi:hypothetical protein